MAALYSMTGFARSSGLSDGLAWAWELRSVNGRGLDPRLRLPAGFDALEPALRDLLGKRLRRGNVIANLAAKRDERARLTPDPVLLEEALQAALALAARIPGAPPPRAESLLALPGILRQADALEAATDAQRAEVLRGFMQALDGLAASRQAEGERLHAVLLAQLNEIAALVGHARDEAADQPTQLQARLQESLRALLHDKALPEDRIAQEVAMLATRSDVREELDRLGGHLQAARALLAEGAGAGRRLDFLVQELVREVNTLCSKSVSMPLTSTGLRLKAVIEQMREQAQNVE